MSETGLSLIKLAKAKRQQETSRMIIAAKFLLSEKVMISPRMSRLPIVPLINTSLGKKEVEAEGWGFHERSGSYSRLASLSALRKFHFAS